jgi:hypothetical protein
VDGMGATPLERGGHPLRCARQQGLRHDRFCTAGKLSRSTAESPQRKLLWRIQQTKKPGNSESQGGGGLKPFPGAIGSEFVVWQCAPDQEWVRQHPCQRPARIAAERSPPTIDTCRAHSSSRGHRLSGGKIRIRPNGVKMGSCEFDESIAKGNADASRPPETPVRRAANPGQFAA